MFFKSAGLEKQIYIVWLLKLFHRVNKSTTSRKWCCQYHISVVFRVWRTQKKFPIFIGFKSTSIQNVERNILSISYIPIINVRPWLFSKVVKMELNCFYNEHRNIFVDIINPNQCHMSLERSLFKLTSVRKSGEDVSVDFPDH